MNEANTMAVKIIKCDSCGETIVVDTSTSKVRCHWCRNILTLENDGISETISFKKVLPFLITKEEARSEIEKFMQRRKFFVHPNFNLDFTSNNIMPVYFPFMLVDVDTHVSLKGEGEHQDRKYTLGIGKDGITYYDATFHKVEREFNLKIENLTIESNLKEKSKTLPNKKNIITSLMPFDIEEGVDYNPSYLKGITLAKREINIDKFRSTIVKQATDISWESVLDTITYYDRGIIWQESNVEVGNQNWQEIYLPVWIYGYQEIIKDKKTLHYIAINARTKKITGSLPLHIPKLLGVSAGVEVAGIIAMFLADIGKPGLVFLLAGFIYYFIIYFKYRNVEVINLYEIKPKTKRSNLREVNEFIEERKSLRNSRIDDLDNNQIEDTTLHNKK